MKKNIAGQIISFQMISSTDGSDVTAGTPTVYVTGDGGTQAAGAGTAAHEGNGCWSYAPSQAETNYDHIAFTMVLTGAISQTVQVFTTFPQTGDSFNRLGAPTGASISTDVAAVKTDAAAILLDTGTDGVVVAAASKTGYALSAMQTFSLVGDITGNLSGSVGSVNGLIPANLDVAVSSRLATTGYTAPDNTGISDILTDTGTTLPAALTALELHGDATWVTATGFMPSTEDGSSFIALPGVILADGAHGGLAASITLADYSNFQSTPPTAAAIRAEIDAGSTQLSGIKVKTDGLPIDPAGQNAVESAISNGLAGLNDLSAAEALVEVQNALDEAFSDASILNTDSVKGRLRILGWLLRNGLTIDEATGDATIKKDDGTTAFTVLGMFTSVAGTTTRKRVE